MSNPNGAYKGRGYLIKIGDGGDPASYSPFLGLTAKSLEFNGDRVDSTTPGTDPAVAIWKTSLDAVKTMALSGDFTMVVGDKASTQRLISQFLAAGGEEMFEVVIPGLGTFTGCFAITGVTLTEDGKQTGSLSLEAVGAPTYVPEA